MRPVTILTGRTFGRLRVIAYLGMVADQNGKRRSRFMCQCSCGNKHDIWGHSLTGGNVNSCGCLRREVSTIQCDKNRRQMMKRRKTVRERVHRWMENYLCDQ